MTIKNVGSAGRFGVRYGKTIKQRIIDVEKRQRRLQKCPYCLRLQAKRVSFGIWKCRKCDSKFTNKAYFVE